MKLLCAFFLLIAPLRAAEPAAELLPPLVKAFSSLGAFQAEYELDVPGMAGTVVYSHNPFQHYCLVQLKPSASEQDQGGDPVLLLMEYPDSPEGRQLRFVLGGKPPYQEMRCSLESVLKQHPSLVPALLFLMLQIDGEQELGDDFMDTENLWPQLLLGVQEHDLKLGYGFQSSRTGASADWLSEEFFAAADAVQKETDRVRLSFGDKGHEVQISTETGLLLLDRWPETAERQELRIKLLAWRRMPRDRGLNALVQGYEDLEVERVPATQLLAPMVASACLQINELLAEKADLDLQLARDPNGTRKRIVSAARLEIWESAAGMVAALKEHKKISDQVYGNYQAWRKDLPDMQGNFSFEDFCALILEKVEEDPRKHSFSHINRLVDKMESGHESMLGALKLPPDAPLLKMYGMYESAWMDAWRMELMTATLEQAKKDLDGKQGF